MELSPTPPRPERAAIIDDPQQALPETALRVAEYTMYFSFGDAQIKVKKRIYLVKAINFHITTYECSCFIFDAVRCQKLSFKYRTR
jgi:hypothetical protein